MTYTQQARRSGNQAQNVGKLTNGEDVRRRFPKTFILEREINQQHRIYAIRTNRKPSRKSYQIYSEMFGIGILVNNRRYSMDTPAVKSGFNIFI